MNHHTGAPLVYRAFRAFGAPFRFRVMGLENIMSAGPAVYTANHLGSLGPIQAILSVPVRFHPWVIGEMLDPTRAPRYLHDDFVGPELHLNGWVGMAVATTLSWISVRLLSGAGAIAVDSNRGLIGAAFRHSLDLLGDGRNLLVFPEDEAEPADPETGMHPFKCGFAELCAIHQRRTGERLPVYPMAVHPGSRMLAIGKAQFLQDGANHRQALQAACLALRQEVCGLYMELSNLPKGA